MKLFVSYIVILIHWVVPTMLLNQFGGQHLIFAGFHYPPYDILIRHPDGNYTMKGSNMYITDWVSLKINLTYSILPVNDPQEIAKMGYYEAAFSKIITKQADALVACFVIDLNRAARMDYTSGMSWTEPYNLVVPKPEFQSRLFAFVRPFQPLVWLGLLLSIIAVVLVMTLFSWIYNKFPQPSVANKRKKNKEKNKDVGTGAIEKANPIDISTNGLSYYSIYAINILTNHGNYSPYLQHSFRILASGLLLASLVLVNSYSSIVMSSLTVPIRDPPVNSLKDLVGNKDVALILQKNNVLGLTILNAQTGLYKTLGDELRRHPERMLMDYATTVKYLQEGKYAYPWISSFNRNMVTNQYLKDGKCKLQLSDPIEASTGYFMALLQKGSKYKEDWSHALMYLWETGLSHYWVDHQTKNADICFDKKPPKTSKPTKIKLGDLTSAFLILGIGLGLAAICLLYEIVSDRLGRRYRV